MEMQDKLALINENLVEVLNPELIERPLAEGSNPRIYWVRSYSNTYLPNLNMLTIFFVGDCNDGQAASRTVHICKKKIVYFVFVTVG